MDLNPYRSIICDTSHEIGIFQSLGATKMLLYSVSKSDVLSTRYLLSNQLLTYGVHWFVELELELELHLLFHFKWTCNHSFYFISRLSDVPITIYIPYWIVGILLAFLTLLSFLASIDSIRSVVSQSVAFIAKGGKY